MFGPRKDGDEASEHQLERRLRLLRRQLRDRRWFVDNELQLGDKVDHEPPVRAQRLPKGVAPTAQLGVALAEKRSDEALKSLGERRIRDVALVLVELTRGEQPARRNEYPVQLVHDRGLADAGIAGDQHQFRR